MTAEDFFNKYNGKGIDYDGYYGFQCVDLFRQYVKECLEFPQCPGTPGAKDIWNVYLPEYFDRIQNTPTNVPKKGDIVLWDANAGGGWGHVAIFNSGDSNAFVSFDQNWPVGSLCHMQNHNYTNVQGWLSPKTITLPEEVVTNPDAKIDLSSLSGATALHEPYGVLQLQQIKQKFIEKDNRIANFIISVPPAQQEDVRIQKIKDVINGSGWSCTKYNQIKDIIG